MKFLSFGEILFDIIDGKSMLGGAPLNVAVNLARLGISSGVISRVGNDNYGKEAIEQIKNIGVDSSLIQIDEVKQTGTVEVALMYGQPHYTIHNNVAYDFIESEEAKRVLNNTKIGMFYFGTLAQRNAQSRKALYEVLGNFNFPYVYYDCNLRKGFYDAEVINESLSYCSIFKSNEEELRIVFNKLYKQDKPVETACRILTDDYDLKVIIITAGDQGCYVHSEGKLNFVAGFKIKVHDTVGAGDAFSAGFIYKFLETGDILKAAQTGNLMGSYVASSKGAILGFSEKLRRDIESI